MSNQIALDISESGVFFELPGVASTWRKIPTWLDDSETGKRRPIGPPETDGDGRTIWQTDVLAYQSRYGRREVLQVTLRCATADPNGPEMPLSLWPLVHTEGVGR